MSEAALVVCWLKPPDHVPGRASPEVPRSLAPAPVVRLVIELRAGETCDGGSLPSTLSSLHFRLRSQA